MGDSKLRSVADKNGHITLHRHAAALRETYRVGVGGRVPLGHLGFHPANRGGQASNGERCFSLLDNMLLDGYDGDHGGSLAQEVPGGSEVQAFNDNSLRGDPLLTPSIEGISAG